MRRTRLRLRDYGESIVSELVKVERGDGQKGWTYPRSVSVSLWFSPSISKILIVLSEEHVARRRP